MKIQKRIGIFILSVLFMVTYSLSGSETFNIIPDAGTTAVAGFADNFNNSIWSVYNNQANLGEFNSHLVSFSYKRLMNMFNLINLAGGFNLKYGYAGIGVSYVDYGSESLITGLDSSTGLPVGGESFYSYDLLFIGSYGYNFESIDMSVGLGIKFLQNSIANRGLLYSVFDVSLIKMVGDLKLNLNVKNIDIGLSSLSDLPFNANFNILIPSKLFIKSASSKSSFYLLGGVNMDVSDTALSKVYGSLGFKVFLNNKINLSTGFFIGKNNEFFNFNSLGVGYGISNNFDINYSFSKDSDYTEFTHCFSMDYKIQSFSSSSSKKSRKQSTSKKSSWEEDDLDE